MDRPERFLALATALAITLVTVAAGVAVAMLQATSARAALPATPPPTTTLATPPPVGSASCSAAYSLVNSWPGGFQAQVTVKNTGSVTLIGWSLGWTFPGDQKITSLWNGGYTQTGQAVSVANAAYNGAVAPGGTTTLGFTATDSTGAAPPSGVTCT